MDYGFFVQDDWKLTPRLTLNLGLRYDYEQFPPPFPFAYRNSSLVDRASQRPGPFPDSRGQHHQSAQRHQDFGPRVGLSWDPTGHGKTVVHAGYGLYYGRNPTASS